MSNPSLTSVATPLLNIMQQQQQQTRIINTSQLRFIQVQDGVKLEGIPNPLRLAMPQNSLAGIRTIAPTTVVKSIGLVTDGNHLAVASNFQSVGKGPIITNNINANMNNLQLATANNSHSFTIMQSNVIRSPVKVATVGGTEGVMTGAFRGPVVVPSNQLSTGLATQQSPSKFIIQINSNQLPLLTGAIQQRPVVAVGQQRLQGAGTNTIQAATNSNNSNHTDGTQLIRVAAQIQQAQSLSAKQPVPIASNKTKPVPVAPAPTQQRLTQVSTTQRLILPATAPVRFAVANSNVFQQQQQSNGSVGSSVTFLAPALSQSNYTLVKAPVVQQQNSNQTKPVVTQRALYPATLTNLQPASKISTSRQSQYSTDSSSVKQRKPCNCTRSQCLKLYCECFANGEFCSDCNCVNCNNNLDHESDRSAAIKACIDRNPFAFHPKIADQKFNLSHNSCYHCSCFTCEHELSKGGTSRQHSKGCNCKRSGCLKNYCECYEAKISCSNLCRCVGCRNVEENSDRQTLLQLADAAEVRVQQQTAAESRLSTHILGPPVKPLPPAAGAQRPPYTFVTLEVVEAMCSCLLAEVEDGESSARSDVEQERLILREFGRCLNQVIETAGRSRAPTPQV